MKRIIVNEINVQFALLFLYILNRWHHSPYESYFLKKKLLILSGITTTSIRLCFATAYKRINDV
jgi:hypothetical protein